MCASRVSWKSQPLLNMPAWRHDHCIEWDDAAVMDQASRHMELLVKEVLHIRMAAGKDSLNKNGGVELHDCWLAIVRRCVTAVAALPAQRACDTCLL